MAKFEIESDIPMPPVFAKKGFASALRELAKAPVGSSVFIPRKIGGIGPSLRRAAPAGVLSCRTVEGGIRVWKVKEPE